jgi:hypothetical protein
MTVLAMTWLVGCQCANGGIVELGSDTSTSASGEPITDSSTSSNGSTGTPFDASRWIGRYHFENPYLPFGERGDPHGTYVLANVEILPKGQTSMFYDRCSLDEAFTIAYEWFPADDGWLSLRPGPGESSLRFLSDQDVDTLRIRLVEPCRELMFEVDGAINTAFTFYPGESCWVDRCTTPGIMQVDYCEGEEWPPCP